MTAKANTKVGKKEDNMALYVTKQKIANKKIYFDINQAQVKIGYNEESGIGFVEISNE